MKRSKYTRNSVKCMGLCRQLNAIANFHSNKAPGDAVSAGMKGRQG